jgi:Galactosyltransferase
MADNFNADLKRKNCLGMHRLLLVAFLMCTVHCASLEEVDTYVHAFKSGFNHEREHKELKEEGNVCTHLSPLRAEMESIALSDIDVRFLKSNGESNSSALLAIGIMSARENAEKRMLMRQTWFTLMNKSIQIGDERKRVGDLVVAKFIVGEHGCAVPHVHRVNMKCDWKSDIGAANRTKLTVEESRRQAKLSVALIEEAARYGDIVLLDHLDDYRGLARKVVHFYAFVSKYVRTRWLLKTDDDALVLVDKVVRELLTNTQLIDAKRTMWSRMRTTEIRQRSGKHKETVYPLDHYPPFPTSTACAMTSDLAALLANNHDSLVYYANEDAAHGIWMLALGHVQFVNDWRMGCTCNAKALVISVHGSEKTIARVYAGYNAATEAMNCNR